MEIKIKFETGKEISLTQKELAELLTLSNNIKNNKESEQLFFGTPYVQNPCFNPYTTC